MATTYNIEIGKSLDTENADKAIDSLAGRLFKDLKGRIDTLEEHQAFMEGAPLGNEFDPGRDKEFNGMEQLREMARNNYARLIVSSVTNKCGIEGFRTAAANDEYGDERVAELFDRDDMQYNIQDAIEIAAAYRRSYLYVDPISKRQRIIPTNNAAVLMDSDDEPAAAIVLRRDRVLERDVLQLFTRSVNEETGQAEGPVRLFVATRDIPREGISRKGIILTSSDREVPLDTGIIHNWVWWKEVTVDSTSRIPVTVLKNKDGKNEFEDATDNINRLNHMIFQRVIVATMQAFRQRAITGDFPKKDAKGRDIDYTEMFESGPARLWQLPAGAEIWESSTTEYGGLLEAVRADERSLGAQTSTPMNYFSDSVNNSAEGAATQKESYYDRVEDRRRRFGSRLRRHVSILMEVNGEAERAEMAGLEVIWKPIESLSLSEKTAAFATLSAKLSVKTALREGMQMTPREIQRAINENLDDAMRRSFADPLNVPTPLKKSQEGNQSQASTVGNTSETLLKAKTEGRKANQ